MRGRFVTTAGTLVGLAMLAAACGGTVAGRAGERAAEREPADTTLGRFLPTTEAPTAAAPAGGRNAAADDDERPVVPATTVAPSITLPSADRDPVVRRPSTTAVPASREAPTTVAPAVTAPPAPGARPAAPTYPPYDVRPGITGEAALTGLPAGESIVSAPILAMKIDNQRRARPQWALDRADVIFEENVEGATRFVALFHSDVPAEVGPVRSARTTDIDLLSAMNRPVLGWSGGNPGVTAWIRAASDAGMLIDVAAVRSNCYRRDSSRRAPHNLLANTACILGRAPGAGPARPLWAIDDDWTPSVPTGADTSFEVPMDGGMRAGWTWDPAAGLYLRSQNGQPHTTVAGARVSAANVVVVYVNHVPSAVDARSPEAITVGEGLAVVHRDGRKLVVNWSRRSADAPFVFRLAGGSIVPLDVGRTFVELARSG